MGKKFKILGEFIAYLTLGAAMFASLLLFGGALTYKAIKEMMNE